MTLQTAKRFRGDTVPFSRSLTQNNVAYDLTGATATVMSLSTQLTGGTILGPITGVVTSTTGGVVTFDLSSLNLAVGTYYWDVQVTKPAGIEIIEKGVLTIDQDLTA